MKGSRWLRRFLDGFILLLISWLLLAAAYVSLGRQFVPALADYQTELREWAEQQTGRAIDLQDLKAEMQGAQPVLTLHGLRVYEAADRSSPVLLDLEHVTARIDVFASLWQRKPVMDALQLDGLALTFIEDAEGQWRLDGLGRSDPDSGGLDDALEHLFGQRRITLLDSNIRISPWAQPDWVFSDGDLTLLNRGHRHRLDARLRLPDRQMVSLQLKGSLPDRDWQRADMEFFAELPPNDWSDWLPAEWLEQAHIERLVAGAQLWGRWHGVRLERLSGLLQAPLVELALARPGPAIEDLQLQFNLQLEDDQQRLDIQQLSLQLAQHHWPETRMQLSRDPQRGDWQAHIERVPLDLLGQWLPSACPDERMADILTTLTPEGELRHIQLNGGALDDVADWSVLAELHQVGVRAWRGVPAMAGISGVISGTPAAGELRVRADDWSMHLPELFPEPWHYQQLLGAANWRWDELQGLQLSVPGARVQGSEGVGSAQLDLHIPPTGGTPTMDLRVALQDTRAEYHGKYLPTRSSAMEPALVQWLEDADIHGEVPQVIFAYQGALRRDATSDQRLISLHARLQQGRLNFQPGWPALEAVDGTLRLRNLDMQIDQARGRLRQTELDDIHVALKRTPEQDLALQIEGALHGPLADGLHIMQQTPLAELTGDPLADWSGEGSLQGTLQLDIPLGGRRQPDVRLQLEAHAARLDIPYLKAPLNDLTGHFAYDHRSGLSSEAIAAHFLGQPVTARLDVNGAGTHHLRMNGSHSAEQLRSWPLLAALPEKLAEGSAAWEAELLLGNDVRRLLVHSDLQGMRLDLPGELAKARDSRLPSRLQMEMGEPSRWQFQLGNDLRGLIRERNGVVSGDIRYRQGVAQPSATEGIAVSARFDQVLLEEWRDWWQAGVLPVNALDDLGGPEALSGVLAGVHVEAGQVSGFGLDLQDLEVVARPAENGWELVTDHPQLSGRVRLPSADAEPIVLDLQRLRIPHDEDAIVDTQGLIEPLVTEDALKDIDPGAVPAMQVNIDQLYWGSKLIGSIAFNMQPAADALDITAMDLQLNGGLQMLGRMHWGAARTRFDGSLAARDIGKVLSAWDYAPTISSRNFNAQVALDWPGSPAGFALKRSSGSLAVQAEDGALHSGESSAEALRVFGLLNFNALTRRLRLDFSDLFGKGIAYDTFSGEAVLTRGLLQTLAPLEMDGPGVKLQLDGTLDLAADRVDMGLLVTLPVTNNLPLAAIIAGAPQIGGVLFLVDRILGDRVARFASVRYRVNGSWKQPNVEFDRAFDNTPALED